MKITWEWLSSGGTPSGETGFAWNAKQLALLGIKWPPKRGWVNLVLGREIDDKMAARFITLNPKKALEARQTEKTRCRAIYRLAPRA